MLEDDAGAHAPADQVHPGQAERVDQRGQVVGPVPHPAAGVDRQRVGAPEAAQVDRERPPARVEGEQLRLPERRGADVAVHEQHRLAAAGGVDALGVQHLLGQPGGGHRGGGDAGEQQVSGQGRSPRGPAGSAPGVPGRLVAAAARGQRLPAAAAAHLPSAAMASTRVGSRPATGPVHPARRPAGGAQGPAAGPRRSLTPFALHRACWSPSSGSACSTATKRRPRAVGQPLRRPRADLALTTEQTANAATIAAVGPLAGAARPGHGDRAGHRAAGVPAAEPRPRRPRLPRPVPAAALAGLGHAEQVQDPVYAAGKFFDHLVEVPGWETGRLTEVAQTVQRSGFPRGLPAVDGMATAWPAPCCPTAPRHCPAASPRPPTPAPVAERIAGITATVRREAGEPMVDAERRHVGARCRLARGHLGGGARRAVPAPPRWPWTAGALDPAGGWGGAGPAFFALPLTLRLRLTSPGVPG